MFPQSSDIRPPYSNADNCARVAEIVKQTADLRAQNVTANLRDLAKTEDIKFGELMKCLRSVLSGLKQGPPVGEMVEHLGRDTTIKRLSYAIEALGKDNLADGKE